LAMPRRPAKITQADVARAMRAAKQAGAAGIEIKPDGTILVMLSPQISPEDTVDEEKRIAL
jgi:hypothetical protein